MRQASKSAVYLRRCRAIVERSTVTRDEGRITGSDISVLMMGSRNSSQASAYVSSSCCCRSARDWGARGAFSRWGSQFFKAQVCS